MDTLELYCFLNSLARFTGSPFGALAISVKNAFLRPGSFVSAIFCSSFCGVFGISSAGRRDRRYNFLRCPPFFLLLFVSILSPANNNELFSMWNMPLTARGFSFNSFAISFVSMCFSGASSEIRARV